MNNEKALKIKDVIDTLYITIDSNNHIIDMIPSAMQEMLYRNVLSSIAILKTAEMSHNMDGMVDYQELYKALKPLLTDKTVTESYNKWRSDISEMDAETLKCKRMQVVIDVLKRGIMEFDKAPRNMELYKVSEDRISPWMSCEEKLTDDLKKEFAKLYRYLIIEEDLVLINRRKFGKYAMDNMLQFSYDSTKALFELEAVLDMINEDFVSMNPALQKVIDKHRPQPRKLNAFAPAINIKKALTKPEVLKLVADGRYTKDWMEQFVDSLLASKPGREIIDDWNAGGKYDEIPAYVAGALKEADVFKASNADMARALMVGSNIRVSASSCAVYVGRGKRQKYLDWVIDYVKSN